MASAEDFVLNLRVPTGPTDAATAALNKLESQIMREQAALSGLESKLDSAKSKLVALEASGAASKSAGIEKQGQVVDALGEKLDYVKRQIEAIKAAGSGGDVATLSKFKTEAADLSGKLSDAKAKLDALSVAGPKNAPAIEAQKKAIGDLDSKIASATVAANERIAEATDKVAKQQASAAAAKAKLDDKMLTQSEKLAAQDANDAANNSLEGKIKGMAGAMEGANGATGKLTAALRSLGPEGAAIAAVLTVVIAVVGAVVIAFRDLAAAAISISQEKDALAATFKALSTGSESGRELVDSLSEVAAALPFAEGKVLAWGKSFMAAGIEGDKLTAAVNATAAATALMGDEGGQAVQTMVKQLAMGGDAADAMIKTVQAGGKRAAVQLAAMGLQAADLARILGTTPEKFKTMKLTADQLGDAIEKAVTEKGAGAIEAMGLTWDSIKGKLGDGAEDLFEDMGSAVQPFMREVKSLFSEFFAGSTTMSTVKDVITAVLTEVFSVATRVVNFIHKGFLQVEIAAFKVVAALWPIISVLIAIGSNKTFIDGLVLSLKGIGVVLLIVVAAVGVMFVAINTVIAFFGAMVGVVISAVGIIVGALAWCVGDAVRAFGVMTGAISGFASGAYEAASNFVMGIVNGITNGVGAVVAAVKGLASAGMSAFTGFFKIHSPSQLMADTAIHIPGGIVEGVEAGTGDVEAAMTDMSGAGASAATSGLATKRGTGGGGDTYNVNVQYSGAKEDFADFETKFRMLVEKLRGLAPRNA